MPHLAVLLLSLIVTAPETGASLESPDVISYSETGSNGVGQFSWYIRTGGDGRYQSKGPKVEGTVDAILSVGPSGFRELEVLLAPLEGRRELQCQQSVDDRATGKLSWTRGDRTVTLHIDQGCIAAPGEGALLALDKTNQKILRWAKTDRWDADQRYDRIIVCGPKKLR